ncbi:transmembrane emp24 domain-containing protein p24delta9-like [Cicer arietinum]|uniref:Transmembrane emp24 domain-containing protein p24delta9-like n=1 Tax=Cicer arietinum TaxID=3827 RepID=A0A1S2XPB1_CICAR|nr:transmembrane emp24 domain-containing protein p24delta9-like [Cicer arietinum]
MFNSIFLIVVVVSTLMCSFVNSMRFNLNSDQPKCITEDIKRNAMTIGKYSVVNLNEGYPIPDSHKITVRVRSPIGNNYHFGNHVDSGNFAFTTTEAGDYTACFSVLEQKPSITVTIDFEWRSGVADRDWYKVAKKDKIEVMEYELQRLYDTVTLIHEEMFYLREREEEMQDLNKATDNKMFTFIFLSIIVCLSVAGLQLWHLKIFFERKKLL